MDNTQKSIPFRAFSNTLSCVNGHYRAVVMREKNTPDSHIESGEVLKLNNPVSA